MHTHIRAHKSVSTKQFLFTVVAPNYLPSEEIGLPEKHTFFSISRSCMDDFIGTLLPVIFTPSTQLMPEKCHGEHDQGLTDPH